MEKSLLRVQHDWEEEFSIRGKSSFWVSYSRPNGERTLHSSVNVETNESMESYCRTEDGFRIMDWDKQTHTWIKIAAPGEETSVTFYSPTKTFSLHDPKKSVNCVDVSPQGELGISGADNGSLKIWAARTGEVLRDLQGHVGDVLVTRFFPSGEVVLSAGSDTQIKIFSALEGYCAATMRGHALGVLGCALVERGRNFITCSRDGTAKLWDTASQSCIATFGDAKIDQAKNGCVVVPNANATTSSRTPDSREQGTDGKKLLIAGEDAHLAGIDLRRHQEIFRVSAGRSALNCCATTSNYFFAGSDSGDLLRWDARAINKGLVSQFNRNNGAVTDLQNFGDGQLWMTTADGLCSLYDVASDSAIKELSGSDYERIHKVATNKELVFTAGRDGKIRQYKF
eukprot:TRINITY_DN8273_c0_g1_i1.p1 TRINITY_DN8273_c0_g1~~TRINITY_DN8273_c0_g1_i1.p1  ORF type:complete len:410 (+),score=36.64 TRINITY_DN8273_c0_g1_i1:39-1232(+)